MAAEEEAVERQRVVVGEAILRAQRSAARHWRLLAGEASLAERGDRDHEIGTRDRPRRRASILVDVARAEQRELSLLLADVAAAVDHAGRRRADIHATAEPKLRFLTEDDVDDAGRAFGVVLRRRIRRDLDVLHGAGGQLREKCAELIALERRRPTVDLHDDVCVAAQAHVVRSIDLDERNVAQHVDRRSAARDGHVLDAVTRPIRRQHDVLALGHRLRGVELRRDGVEPDGTDVDNRLLDRDGDVVAYDGRETDRPDSQRVAPRAEAVHAERSVVLWKRATHEHGVTDAADRHGATDHRMAAGRIDEPAVDFTRTGDGTNRPADLSSRRIDCGKQRERSDDKCSSHGNRSGKPRPAVYSDTLRRPTVRRSYGTVAFAFRSRRWSRVRSTPLARDGEEA